MVDRPLRRPDRCLLLEDLRVQVIDHALLGLLLGRDLLQLLDVALILLGGLRHALVRQLLQLRLQLLGSLAVLRVGVLLALQLLLVRLEDRLLGAQGLVQALQLLRQAVRVLAPGVHPGGLRLELRVRPLDRLRRVVDVFLQIADVDRELRCELIRHLLLLSSGQNHESSAGRRIFFFFVPFSVFCLAS